MTTRARSSTNLLLAIILTASLRSPLRAPADPAPTTVPAATRPNPPIGDTLIFPTYGISLEQPPGFRRMAEGAPHRIVQWTRATPPDNSNITSLIYIEVEAAEHRPLKEYAQAAAVANAGKLQPDLISINGAPACLIAGATENKPFAHHYIIVARHEDQMYSIFIMESPGDPCDVAVNALCKSIRWRKIEDAADHLTDLKKHTTIFGKISLDLPAAMRGGDSNSSANRARFSLWNLKTNRQELLIDFQLASFDHRNSFDDVRMGYSLLLKKRYALDSDLVWKSVHTPGGLDVWNTQPVEYSAEESDGKPFIAAIQWALVNVNTDVVVIVFNFGHRTLEQSKAYTATVPLIVGTVAPADEKQSVTTAP
jgi:hypothetical protein